MLQRTESCTEVPSSLLARCKMLINGLPDNGVPTMSFDRVLLIKEATKASSTSCSLCETELVTLQLTLASDQLQLLTTSVKKLRELLKGGFKAGSNPLANQLATVTRCDQLCNAYELAPGSFASSITSRFF